MFLVLISFFYEINYTAIFYVNVEEQCKEKKKNGKNTKKIKKQIQIPNEKKSTWKSVLMIIIRIIIIITLMPPKWSTNYSTHSLRSLFWCYSEFSWDELCIVSKMIKANTEFCNNAFPSSQKMWQKKIKPNQKYNNDLWGLSVFHWNCFCVMWINRTPYIAQWDRLKTQMTMEKIVKHEKLQWIQNFFIL